MLHRVLGFVIGLSLTMGAGAAFAGQYQGQEQGQQQAQDVEVLAAAIAAALAVQGQFQQGIVRDGDVNVPRQHRRVPDVNLNVPGGASGVGVSGPGFSAGGVQTDAVVNAQQFVEFCNALNQRVVVKEGEARSEGTLCSEDDYRTAKQAAQRSIEGCDFLGPVGKLLSLIPFIEVTGLPYENTKGFLRPLCF